METRVAIIGILVENPDSVEQMNTILHEYGKYIIGTYDALSQKVCHQCFV